MLWEHLHYIPAVLVWMMSHLWCRFRFAVETIVDIDKKNEVKLINSSMKKNKSGIVLDKHNASVLAIEWTVDFPVLAQ